MKRVFFPLCWRISQALFWWGVGAAVCVAGGAMMLILLTVAMGLEMDGNRLAAGIAVLALGLIAYAVADIAAVCFGTRVRMPGGEEDAR